MDKSGLKSCRTVHIVFQVARHRMPILAQRCPGACGSLLRELHVQGAVAGCSCTGKAPLVAADEVQQCGPVHGSAQGVVAHRVCTATPLPGAQADSLVGGHHPFVEGDLPRVVPVRCLAHSRLCSKVWHRVSVSGTFPSSRRMMAVLSLLLATHGSRLGLAPSARGRYSLSSTLCKVELRLHQVPAARPPGPPRARCR